ncbi:Bardet-Biedl syndrome 7 protein homolog isoform X3 [Colias croceus]|uniref:Bardet-Biedl syndrome 7 protein homolog isoform X3 n=1 Tax=Colias crocea TaxID=72248 RepID=UPI001E27E833|nr:Bardet-Biedl syndrome 7 protein homolog isoform X3 [Colias croceus]
MEYDLSRIDYILCGITYPETLKILPTLGDKLQQKFAVGDKSGVFQCLAIKDEEPVIQFKTLPGKPITSVQLAISTGSNVDKIFAASGNEVKGYTRKGKVFLTIESPVSETITSMCVLGNDLILCSGRTITFCKDFREITTFMCEDRILDAAAFKAVNSNRIRLLLLIANKGAVVVENGHVITRIYIQSGPSRLLVPQSIRATDICALYGAADGSIGIISYNESQLTSKCLEEGQGLGSVMCVGWFYNHVGTHLAVGRHDGSIQLYLINPEKLEEKLQLKFTYFCGEPVTSISGGCIGTDEPELLAATFSGRVFGLRPRRLLSSTSVLNNIPADALASRRLKLENEVARLEKQTGNERDKYQKSTRSLQSGLSMPPLLDIQHELTGASKNGWQEARIISAVPLDMLFIYCNNKLEIQTENAAVLSICPSQERRSSELLATIRCQAGTRRLWIQMRYFKDILITESVTVFVYVLPAGAPRVARLVKLKLPVLPHYSLHTDENLEESKRRSSATFRSDNVSTLVQLRDIILNCTVKKGLRVDIACDVPEYCCIIAFRSIKDLLIAEHGKKQELKLKEALSSLDLDANTISTEGKSVLCSDYLQILTSPEASTETCFEELSSAIKDWYKDWCKLSMEKKYNNHDLIQLEEAMQTCRLDFVEEIFSIRKQDL